MRRPALWLALLTIVLYLPPALSLVRLNNDSVEFLDIARRLNAGEGYRLGIKAYHFGGTEVLHNGLDERAPLYSFFLAALLRFGLDLPALQVANVLLIACCVGLVYGIGAALFGQRAGVLAGLLAAASPAILAHMVPLMSEALATFSILLAMWLLVLGIQGSRLGLCAAAGATLGLGYLVRPTTLALTAAVILGLGLARTHRRSRVRCLGALLVGVAAIILPTMVYSLTTRGSVVYSGQSYHYAVFDYTAHREFSDRPLPTIPEFIRANGAFVTTAMLQNTRAFAEKVFLDRNWLLPLLPAWPAVLLALARGRYPPAAWPILLLAGANFFVYALTWAVHDRRYQLLLIPLLLPFAVDGLGRLGLARLRLWRRSSVTALHVAMAVVLLLWLPMLLQEYRTTVFPDSRSSRVRLYDGMRWETFTYWLENVDKVSNREFSQLLDWVATRTEQDDVVAHGFPWPFTFFADRPATLLPANLEPDRLRKFVASYHVAYVVVSKADPDRRGYLEELEVLESEGVRRADVGGYRLFDTRALWQ